MLGVPVVNIGSRQNKRQRANNVFDCDYVEDEIFNAIKNQSDKGHFKSESLYGNGFAGKRIAEVLSSCELTFSKTIAY